MRTTSPSPVSSPSDRPAACRTGERGRVLEPRLARSGVAAEGLPPRPNCERMSAAGAFQPISSGAPRRASVRRTGVGGSGVPLFGEKPSPMLTVTLPRILADRLRDPPARRGWPVWTHYAATVALVLAAYAARLALDGIYHLPFLTFIPAILAASLLFDRGSGLLATVLSAALASRFLAGPGDGPGSAAAAAWSRSPPSWSSACSRRR